MPKIPATERDAFHETRRGELAEVALQLWAERGFDATSVESIAREAGMAKGTFYLYFDSKQALLDEVMRRHSLVPAVQGLVASLQGASLDEAVHAFVKAAWRHLMERRELVMLALRELPSHLEEAQRVLGNVMVPANKLIEAYLQARMGEERASQVSLIIAGRSLLGMVVFTFLTQEVLGAGKHLPVPEEQITSTLAEMFLHGIEGAATHEAK